MRGVLGLVLLAGCEGVLHFEKVSAYDASGSGSGDAGTVDAPTLEDGLVARYSFEDVSGILCAIDSAGGHNGKCSGTATPIVGRNATFGNALYLDGATYVSTAHAVELDPTTAFTVSLWIQPGQYPDALTYWCPISRPYGMITDDSWQICVRGADSYFLFGTAVMYLQLVNVGIWTHLAITWDATTTTAGVYIDGTSVGTMASAQPAYDSLGLWMGADRDNQAPSAFYTGAIDEVRIYNRALAFDEIAALAQ